LEALVSEAAGAPQPNHHDEIAELIREIHEERTAIKEREKAEAWTVWVSLMVVVFAVVAAIGAQQDGSVSTAMVLKQTQASDTWALYQAKGIKAHIAELEMHQAATPEKRAAAEAELEKYRAQQKGIQKKAEALEKERDTVGRKDDPLSNGVAGLQVAIALASVCLIVKRKILWAAAGLFGAIGMAYVAYGLFIV
jgi:hypothetical protein